ncbi:Protoporphyrinogen oxidase [Erysiphe neolycopersici]|uniref:Protoporphyrinogen oxidase n=1 Tax=Erysiphe neolycopersici TaxID=212602 RepID=A0A420I483_9PEZI|nr:Protoporphyrinogen oxidase [Erysiphe neolycopersici]
MYNISLQYHTFAISRRFQAVSSSASKQFRWAQCSTGNFHGPNPLFSRLTENSSLEPRHIHNQRRERKNCNQLDDLPTLNSSNVEKNEPIILAQSQNYGSSFSSTVDHSHVAIIGGGISGLTTAYYHLRRFPNAKVTLYESTNRLGGWLQSEIVDTGHGKVILESGPRTLRYGTTSSLVTAELIQDLGLEDEIIISAKNSIAAKNRFVYYPDHLVRMPVPGESLLWQVIKMISEPVFKGILPAAIEFLRPPRPEELEDESVASFFTRRLGTDHLVNNIHSAILHGIYAGDINQLSAKSLFPTLWYMEKHFGGLLRGVFFCTKDKIELISPSESSIRREIIPKITATLHHKLENAAVFSFKQGLGSLINALEHRLNATPNFSLKLGHKIDSIQLADNGIEIQTQSNISPTKYSHVISTLLPNQTSSLTSKLPSLSLIHSVSVMVVNLFYSSTEILPAHGFGYLIPRTVSYKQNPECALGVVFDSDAIQGQDTASGTKLTVMLGGHWWDSFETYPNEEEGASMAKAVVKRHLGISKEPDLARVKLHKDCIPQYTVGHQRLLSQAKNELSDFMGRLSVTGSGYRGVGVNDCAASARDLVSRMPVGIGSNLTTGLEWVDEDLQQIKLRHTSIS